MTRCRCNDINNANNDLKKLTAIRDYLGEVWQTSTFTISGTLSRLVKGVQNGATPNNVAMFQSIESKLEQPVRDGIKKAHDKCINKIGALPGEIRTLNMEDTAYHATLTAKSSLFYTPR